APVDVAAHVDSIGEAGEHAGQRARHELDALAVVVRPDAVLADQDRHAAGDAPRAADGRLERLRPELVAHLRRAHAVLGAEHAVRAEPRPRVALDADEIVAPRRLEEDVLHVAPVRVPRRFAAADGL